MVVDRIYYFPPSSSSLSGVRSLLLHGHAHVPSGSGSQGIFRPVHPWTGRHHHHHRHHLAKASQTNAKKASFMFLSVRRTPPCIGIRSPPHSNRTPIDQSILGCNSNSGLHPILLLMVFFLHILIYRDISLSTLRHVHSF